MKDFVNYEQAKELKNIGFDEICLTIYLRGEFRDQYLLINCPWRVNSLINSIDIVTAPLYNQVFRWFREKYNLHSFITPKQNDWIFHIINIKTKENITINDIKLNGGILQGEGFFFKTPEEAELGCLNKLIEIVKNERAKSSTRTINSKI